MVMDSKQLSETLRAFYGRKVLEQVAWPGDDHAKAARLHLAMQGVDPTTYTRRCRDCGQFHDERKAKFIGCLMCGGALTTYEEDDGE